MITTVRVLTRSFIFGGILALTASGCASLGIGVTQVEPMPPPPPEAPPLLAVPHPNGLTLGDLEALFTDPSAPSLVSQANCDADLLSLYSKTVSLEERTRGVKELLDRNPVHYHWCFYSRILSLEEALKKADYIDEKQKALIEHFRVIAPLARAFKEKFEDSRYLRWAVREYRTASERVFYRKVEPSPQLTLELVGSGKEELPLPAQREQSQSVLEKYGITPAPNRSPAASEPSEAGPAGANAGTGSVQENFPATEENAPTRGAAPASGG